MPPKPHNNPFPTPQAIPTPEILLPVIPNNVIPDFDPVSFQYLVIAGLTRNPVMPDLLRNLIPLVIAGSTRNLAFSSC